MDKASHGGRIVFACIMFALAGPWMIWSSRTELRAAQQGYEALPATPSAQYEVTGRSSATEGQGKSRKTVWFLHLRQSVAMVTAARETTVRVSRRVHDGARNGETWNARIAAGQPVFDPGRTDYEASRSRTARNFGVGALAFAILLFALHRSGRLYRPLFGR